MSLETRQHTVKKGPKSVGEAEDTFNRAVEEKSNRVAEEKEAQKQHAHAEQALAVLQDICEKDPSDDSKAKLEEAQKLVSDTLAAYTEAKRAVKAINRRLGPLKGQISRARTREADNQVSQATECGEDSAMSDLTDIDETATPLEEPPKSATPSSTSEPGASEEEHPSGVIPAPVLAVPESVMPNPSSTGNGPEVTLAQSLTPSSGESVSLAAVPEILPTTIQPLPQATSSSDDASAADIPALSIAARSAVAPAQAPLPQAVSSRDAPSVATPTISMPSRDPMSTTVSNPTAMSSEGTDAYGEGTQDAKRKRASSGKGESDLKIVKKAREEPFEDYRRSDYTLINKAKGRGGGKGRAKQQDDGDADGYDEKPAGKGRTPKTEQEKQAEMEEFKKEAMNWFAKAISGGPKSIPKPCGGLRHFNYAWARHFPALMTTSREIALTSMVSGTGFLICRYHSKTMKGIQRLEEGVDGSDGILWGRPWAGLGRDEKARRLLKEAKEAKSADAVTTDNSLLDPYHWEVPGWKRLRGRDPRAMDCGCSIDEVLMEGYLWKDTRFSSISCDDPKKDSWRDDFITPRQHVLNNQAFRNHTGLTLDDLYSHVAVNGEWVERDSTFRKRIQIARLQESLGIPVTVDVRPRLDYVEKRPVKKVDRSQWVDVDDAVGEGSGASNLSSEMMVLDQ
ncbi:hypothetical protein MPER_13100 [Moniliophthora perniciosa FA553]|nr:hypothetical protein MPER_13100 [Moniliophthora perniciosa FA553]